MKQSYYNCLARRGGLNVLYNTLSQNIVSLSDEEVAWLNNLDSCGDAAFLEQLERLEFIHEDPEIEPEWLKYQHLRYSQNNYLFELTISPTQECNYCCPYCYVQKRDGFMSEQVQDKIVEFVCDQYEEAPFKRFRVNWYGGEPLLGIDVMERLSAAFISFCRARNVTYQGHILTNASLADEKMVGRLVENCGIVSVMPTLSGEGAMQDAQRPAKDGSKNFDVIMRNIDLMAKAGITVLVNFVTNNNNCEGCLNLARSLHGKDNIEIRLTTTFPFGKDRVFLADETHSELSIFTPQEYACYRERFLAVQGLDAEGYRKALEPIPLYCAGWVRRAYYIDDLGNVTGCMVDMDYPGERAFFNILDWGHDDMLVDWRRHVALANLNPLDSKKCRTCRIFPICRGGCCDHWLTEGVDPCAEQRNIDIALPQMVLDYYDALIAEGAAV